MDLHDFDTTSLYFEDALAPEAEALIQKASDEYGEEGAELHLLKAYFIAPAHLTVLVALYRYYFYQHRLEDALLIADRAMSEAAERMHIPDDWRKLDANWIGHAAMNGMGLLRFYLMSLKAAAIVEMRLGELTQAIERLEKLTELDTADRLGIAPLLDLAKDRQLMLNDNVAA